jgi:Flp pilus assembly protein TadD
MNRRPCYFENPESVVLPDHRFGAGAVSASPAMIAAVLLVLASTFLAGCKSATQYISRGNQLYSAGQYGDAVLNYRNALKKSPNSGEAYYRLGLALMKQNQITDAYQAFSHAVSLTPGNWQAQVQLANLSLTGYARDPRHPPVLYKQAESIAEKLMGPGGDRVEGLRIKGALALIDNQPDRAVQTLREAAGIAPNNAEVGSALAQALQRDNQPEEAEKTALDTVRRHPQFDEGYEVLYAMYGSQQNWEKAEATLKNWAANNPKASTPVLRLAAFYYARKQPDDAEKTINSLIGRRDQFPQADL